MNVLRSAVRSLALLGMLLTACVDGYYRKWFYGMQPGYDGALWVHVWCRRIVRMLAISHQVSGPLPGWESGGLAVVSNHLSYLDVLVYSATCPLVMVAKSEVRAWPLLGWITAQAGTVYVQRRNCKGGQTQTHAEVNARMTTAYRTGLPVLFFPEGTTTNGAEILPFRRGLYHSVVADAIAVKVAALHYTLMEENPGSSVMDDVCFWGDANFVPHLFRCLGLRGLRVQVCFGSGTIYGVDGFELATRSRAAVADLHGSLASSALAFSSVFDPVALQIDRAGIHRSVEQKGDGCAA